MAFGKRQLVLAALVVALGAAVYLNWQFSGENPLVAAGTDASEKTVGEARLVNASALSSAQPASGASGPQEAGSGAAESGGEAQGKTAEEYFSETRLSRQQSRDEAVELLEDVLEDAGASEEAKKEAVAQAAVIAQQVLQENNIENLVKAKGFTDCVAFLQNGECTVVVQTAESNQSNAIVIKDIVAGQSGVSYDKIKIVELR